jgi:hypothetical protein
MRSRRFTFPVLAMLAASMMAIATPTGGAAAPARRSPITTARDVFTFVVATVMYAPSAVLGADHRRHIAYELQLLNTGFIPVGLQRVDTLDPATGAVLATREGATLTGLIKRPEGGDYDGTLGPGLTGLAILDVSLPANARLPRSLLHRITIAYDDTQLPPGLATSKMYTTGATPVLRDPATVIGPPLRGGRWVAANGCCTSRTDHRGGAIPVNGQLRLPERFAIDFVRLDGDRRLFAGPIDELASYAYYGADLLAVADGRVVRTHDGESEQVPPQFPPPFDPDTAPGNWVVIDIGAGHYVLYAHLQTDSLTVRAGDRVRRGQILGRLGNTGSSSAPHLHFQVMDGPSPSASNGLPYVIGSFTSPGTVTDEAALFSGQQTPVGPALAGRHADELPLNLQVVDFP